MKGNNHHRLLSHQISDASFVITTNVKGNSLMLADEYEQTNKVTNYMDGFMVIGFKIISEGSDRNK
jgi:hypothetical protein